MQFYADERAPDDSLALPVGVLQGSQGNVASERAGMKGSIVHAAWAHGHTERLRWLHETLSDVPPLWGGFKHNIFPYFSFHHG